MNLSKIYKTQNLPRPKGTKLKKLYPNFQNLPATLNYQNQHISREWIVSNDDTVFPSQERIVSDIDIADHADQTPQPIIALSSSNLRSLGEMKEARNLNRAKTTDKSGERKMLQTGAYNRTLLKTQ